MEVFVNSYTGGVSFLLECLQGLGLFIFIFFFGICSVCARVGVCVCARGVRVLACVLQDAPLYIHV